MDREQALSALTELCGPDGQAVEQMFALARSEFWTVRVEEAARGNAGPDGLHFGYRHDPERLARAKANIAAYEAASTRYWELVAILNKEE